MIHPGAKPGPLEGIAPLDPKDAKLNLHEGDSGEVKGPGVHAGQPRDDVGVGFAVAGLAQLGNDVGIEYEHYEKSAGRARSRARGGSNSISASPGMDRASTMLRRLPVMRWYSSMVRRTWAGLPRSVMNTGPSEAAFLARLVS